jgi:nucleoside-diphosphate-sugar epimerase
MTRILVTGAQGQIGSELTAALRDRYGNDAVVAALYLTSPADRLLEVGPTTRLDVTDAEAVGRALADHSIDTVYHLAAVLSATGEAKPQVAWKVNLEGLHVVLEAARTAGARRVFWPSSIAVFGPDSPRDRTPQDTVMRPTTMYGVTKVAGELLCDYYVSRYGMDVRGVRYPGVISSGTLPGGGTTDYAVDMFYCAVLGKTCTCFVRPDTVLPMIYQPDCIHAAIQLMEADGGRLVHHNGFNLASMSFSAAELEAAIRRHLPEFACRYEPDARQQIADGWPRSLDDSAARAEWGWRPKYDLESMTVDMIRALRKRLEAGELAAG